MPKTLHLEHTPLRYIGETPIICRESPTSFEDSPMSLKGLWRPDWTAGSRQYQALTSAANPKPPHSPLPFRDQDRTGKTF